MRTVIYESVYKYQKAVTLEGEKLRVQFLPQMGGKMASLICKKTGREFLTQASNPEYKVLNYDGSYVDSECSGLDDMFPTIDVCHYESYPWSGTRIPDHGEVCGLRWDCEQEADCLHI